MPTPQRVKDYLKGFVKDLGKVFAVRLIHPKKNEAKHNSITTDHDGDGIIHAQISSAFSFPSPTLPSNSSPVHSAIRGPGLESSTNVSSARYSGGVSLAREASDMAQLALPLVQSVANAIPLVGAPMQAAIGGLLTSLQAIDVRACMIASMFLNFKDRYRDATRIRRTSTALYYDSID
jgi:hypothetical protein